jgi:hypothetical protein
VFNAAPGSTVGFFVSGRGQGQGPCAPSSFGGACITLRQPFSLGFAIADANGYAFLDIVVPGSAPVGVPIYLQAIWGMPGMSEASPVVVSTVD